MTKTVLVSGASGFIGSHVAGRLVERGYRVRAMTRHPEDYHGAGDPVRADVGDPGSLGSAFEGADAAYYLVHSLGSDDFEKRDAEVAGNSALAGSAPGRSRSPCPTRSAISSASSNRPRRAAGRTKSAVPRCCDIWTCCNGRPGCRANDCRTSPCRC